MLSKKNLLIIFYRNPELGKVKTRLAATLGDGKALAIYLRLVAHTRSITENLGVDKVVCYSHHIDREDNWPNEIFDKQIQKGEDLGSRLHHSVANGFESGYESVCVIGSDCFELTEGIIEDAFKSLKINDAVIGPAKDGGYYLLGTKEVIFDFFKHKEWSTPSVLKETLIDCTRLGLSYHLLPELKDVDTEADLPDEIRAKLNIN